MRAVKDPMVFRSKPPVIEATDNPSPTPSPMVTVIPTLEPTIIFSPEATGTTQPTNNP